MSLLTTTSFAGFSTSMTTTIPDSVLDLTNSTLVDQTTKNTIVTEFEENEAMSNNNENCADQQLSGAKLPVFCGWQEDDLLSVKYKKKRKIPKSPFKVLDAPLLQDDFYLNLVDWSAQNTLAVGLGSCIYMWNAQNSKVTKLSDIGPTNRVTSVQWSRDGHTFAVGTQMGDLQIWDTVKGKMVRSLKGHDGRICSVAWTNSFVSTGSRDRNILNRDLRESRDYFTKLQGHKQEVCGMKWSFDDSQLASGGNDNKLLVWCARMASSSSSLNSTQTQQPLAKFTAH